MRFSTDVPFDPAEGGAPTYQTVAVPGVAPLLRHQNHLRYLFDSSAGTEELGHLEMVGAIVHQLTRNLKDNQIQDSSFAPYFVDHTVGVYPTTASGTPHTAAFLQVKGDPITDLVEDMGAEAAPHHTAIGFCHFLASRKVVAAQGFFGLLKGEPFC